MYNVFAFHQQNTEQIKQITEELIEHGIVI